MANEIGGFQCKFAIDDSTVTAITDFDSNSFQYESIGEVTLSLNSVPLYNGGTSGTRSRRAEACNITQRIVGGNITLQPTPVELDQWFPRILGAVESTDVFALAETVPEWGCLIERVAKRHIYTGCKVNVATFTSSNGNPFQMSVEIAGKDEIQSATTFPATIPAINGGRPYIHNGQCTFALTADASAAKVAAVTISVNNMLGLDSFYNSLTRTDITPLDREVTVEMLIPYDADSIDLHDQAVAGAGGSITWTNGGVSTVFTFANLKAAARSPTGIMRGGILMLPLNMTAYQSSTTKELVVTHDSAP